MPTYIFLHSKSQVWIFLCLFFRSKGPSKLCASHEGSVSACKFSEDGRLTCIMLGTYFRRQCFLIFIPMLFFKKPWGYCECLHPSIMLSPKPVGRILPNLLHDFPTWEGCSWAWTKVWWMVGCTEGDHCHIPFQGLISAFQCPLLLCIIWTEYLE